MDNGKYLIEMGAKIKAARKANKISLPKLSVQTKMNVSSLWFVENGRRNAHILTLKLLADAFKMDVKDFL